MASSFLRSSSSFSYWGGSCVHTNTGFVISGGHVLPVIHVYNSFVLSQLTNSDQMHMYVWIEADTQHRVLYIQYNKQIHKYKADITILLLLRALLNTVYTYYNDTFTTNDTIIRSRRRYIQSNSALKIMFSSSSSSHPSGMHVYWWLGMSVCRGWEERRDSCQYSYCIHGQHTSLWINNLHTLTCTY